MVNKGLILSVVNSTDMLLCFKICLYREFNVNKKGRAYMVKLVP